MCPVNQSSCDRKGSFNVNLQLSFSSRLPLAVIESDFKNSSNSIISSPPSSSFLVFIVSKTYLQEFNGALQFKRLKCSKLQGPNIIILNRQRLARPLIDKLTRRILKDLRVEKTGDIFLWIAASSVSRLDSLTDIHDTILWFLFWWLKYLSSPQVYIWPHPLLD